MTRKNYNYGKLVNGSLEYAPYYLEHDNQVTVNGSAELYLQNGVWKHIVFSEAPEDEDSNYIESYEENDDSIIVSWIKG